MRVCYHIQSHRSPAQVHRLVSTLRTGSPESIIHVSHDVRGDELDRRAFEAIPGVVVQPARGGYGDWTHVQRWLDAADWLAGQNAHVDWLVNLTGQDYPLMPLAEIEAELDTSGDGYLQWFSAISTGGPWLPRRSRSRYLFHHRRLSALSDRQRWMLRPLQAVNAVQPMLRVHVSYGLTVGIRRPSPFGSSFPLYGGSAYASLSWACVERVRAVVRERPELVAAFRHALSPEEAFLQTVLINDGRFSLINDSKRYFDFRGSRFNHPKQLSSADLPAAFASGKHFGRKFDLAADPKVFDQLDLRVLGGQR